MISGTIVGLKRLSEQTYQLSIASPHRVHIIKCNEKNLESVKLPGVGDYVVLIHIKGRSDFLLQVLNTYSQITAQVLYNCIDMIT